LLRLDWRQSALAKAPTSIHLRAIGSIWREKTRRNIPGSVWRPNTGYGELAAETENYFRFGLERITQSDIARFLVFYCLRDRPARRPQVFQAQDQQGSVSLLLCDIPHAAFLCLVESDISNACLD
jgi:hypothetical protein